ncbi:hypothetical protein M9434_002517 [Picochlorum sp. BPE23]|nr:hypothetical protein M9434_002517 [Picochlorum sp. BPE23]
MYFWTCFSFVVNFREAPDIVTRNRKVWGYRNEHSLGALEKLNEPANYLRFYLPQILPARIKKFLYLDVDTIIAGDLRRIFLSFANKYSLSAGLQSVQTCTLGKQILFGDSRLQSIDLKASDPCISSVLLINRELWSKENRTERIEYWLDSNAKKKLWHLGSFPPLIIEFANQFEPMNDLVADNKGYRVANHLADLTATESIIVHPVKSLSFLPLRRVWLQATISLAHDLPMLPHFLSHYLDAGILPHNFLMILHLAERNDTLFYKVSALLRSKGIIYIKKWIGQYSSKEMNERRQTLRKKAEVSSDDWVVHADSDMLHQFPAKIASFLDQMRRMGYDAVYGYYQDRVTADGTLQNISNHEKIEQQFPLVCHISTQVVQLNRYNSSLNIPMKLLAYRGYLQENQGGGRVRNEKEACIFPTLLRTDHYKWVWPLVAKMELRKVVERDLPFGYQATNVLSHLNSNKGRINVSDPRLNCRKYDSDSEIPASAWPINQCKKYEKIDIDMSNLGK